MSDALTDIARDQRRAENHEDFCFVLADYLDEPTDEKKAELADAAVRCDAVPRGYWGDRTKLAKGLDKWLSDLFRKQDRVAWANLLLSVHDIYCLRSRKRWKCSLYDKLKSFSPFAGKLFTVVDYGNGFATIRGEVQKFLDACVRDKGFCTYDYDKYTIVFDESPVPSDVVWMRCSCMDQSGAYRTPDREERKKRLADWRNNSHS